jgi:outer membrane phospholipase A
MKSFFCLLVLLMTLTALNSFAEDVPEKNVLSESTDKTADLWEEKNMSLLYYKPMYALWGNPTAKIQLSFQFPLVQDFPLRFGYSQFIFWELQASSKPFLDATYNPEFFYRWQLAGNRANAITLGLFEHNSNGKDGADSRSYDQTYVKGTYSFDVSRLAFVMSAKLKYIYELDDENPDLQTYVGPLDLEFQVLRIFDSFLDQGEFDVTLKPGGKYANDWDKGGYEMGLKFHLGGIKIVPAFYLQYYHGYAETLVNYNEKVDEFRGGIVF